MELNKLKTDPALEQDGVWVPFGDARFLVARLNNPRMASAYAAKIRPYRGAKIPEADEERLMLDCLAAHVLLDWEGVTNDGQPFPYSKENSRAALQIKDLADFIITAARDFELFRRQDNSEAVAAIAKNSNGGTAGESTLHG